ncbi:MAG: Gfo/Idh/MocA family oxidoreductase [Verrucomicrobiota bacterium]
MKIRARAVTTNGMINVGIVGLGFMAATHIKAYRNLPHARIAALCNPSGHRLDGDFSDITGNVGDKQPVRLDMAGVKAYRDFHELLADRDIQLIDICSHTPTHPEYVIAALRAGKHVICEKPLARTSELARSMVEAAASAKTYLMPAMCLRFLPTWAWLKAAVTSGAYGKVLGARFRRVAQPPGWGRGSFMDGAKSGGALLDLHVHDVDFAQHCFGRPRAVFATGYSHISGAIDHVVAQYIYPSGISVHAEGAWAMAEGFGFNMSYTVNFERATADYDLARDKEALKLFEKGKPPQVIPGDGPDGYTGELTHILDCIQSGRPPSIVTAQDGLAAVELCEAEEKSIRNRCVVNL